MTEQPILPAPPPLVTVLKAAYVTGSSLNEVAADFAISATQVHDLFKKYCPEILRDNKDPVVRSRAQKKRARPTVTLEALGLHHIGNCLSCRMNILGPDRHGGRQTCTSCMAVKTYGPDYYRTGYRSKWLSA